MIGSCKPLMAPISFQTCRTTNPTWAERAARTRQGRAAQLASASRPCTTHSFRQSKISSLLFSLQLLARRIAIKAHKQSKTASHLLIGTYATLWEKVPGHLPHVLSRGRRLGSKRKRAAIEALFPRLTSPPLLSLPSLLLRRLYSPSRARCVAGVVGRDRRLSLRRGRGGR